ncbi:hypothetical protein PIB30_023648 [Stylosanthes scabra]|uniref:TauD/TfdA-like domain-containing protein n=1 Tax=Stylosanthes scabra TaxID=79078 RepID=A0ABU6R9Q6_9FABA|nr:hypothetical protein [Stylosanthes scabra]
MLDNLPHKSDSSSLHKLPQRFLTTFQPLGRIPLQHHLSTARTQRRPKATIAEEHIREADDDGANLDWHNDTIFNLSWITPLLLEGSDDLFSQFEFSHEGTTPLGEKFFGECGVVAANHVFDVATADF